MIILKLLSSLSSKRPRLKTLFIGLVCAALVSSCSGSEKPENQTGKNAPRVIVMGMIHTAHIESDKYPLSLLEKTIEIINPDIIITEIPPDRLEDAVTSFSTQGRVNEPRVARFPEYANVIFPLTRTMNFEIEPAAAWSQPMAEFRANALTKIARDPNRQADWTSHLSAEDAMNKKLQGKEDDPFFIHTDEYDKIIKEGLTPYATLFAGDLGTGDWEQINRAHYELISAAIDKVVYAKNNDGGPKTILITFGAAHKYWFLEQLRNRKDIKLISPLPYLEMAQQETNNTAQ